MRCDKCFKIWNYESFLRGAVWSGSTLFAIPRGTVWSGSTLFAIIAFTFFKRSTAFNLIETALGVERQEIGVGVEDTIFIEFINSSLVQKISYC